MEEKMIALQVHEKDNVATIFANGVRDGAQVELRDKKGSAELLRVIGDVPYGHKIAVRDIPLGQIRRGDRRGHPAHPKGRVCPRPQPGQHAGPGRPAREGGDGT